MGSNSFFSKLVTDDPINQLTTGGKGTNWLPGMHEYQSPGSINNPLAGASPQSGVTPTLAAANQGYQVAPTGASTDPNQNQVTYGMNPTPNTSGGGAMQTPNPYAAATQQRKPTTGGFY
jgi:hypothetical protein